MDISRGKIRDCFEKQLKEINKNIKDCITKFENSNKLFQYMKDEKDEFVRNYLKDGIIKLLNDTYSQLSTLNTTIDKNISKLSSIGIHTFDIFNCTKGREEKELKAPSKEELIALFKMTEENIEILKEYDEFGDLVYVNENPEYRKDFDYCDHGNPDEINNMPSDYVKDEDIHNLQMSISEHKIYKSAINRRAQLVHVVFLKAKEIFERENEQIEDGTPYALVFAKYNKSNITDEKILENPENSEIRISACGISEIMKAVEEKREEFRKIDEEDEINRNKEDVSIKDSEKSTETKEKKQKKTRKNKKNVKKNPKAD